MANLEVSEINVPGLIKKLKTSEWLSPLFQREFVWSNADVVSLVNSIIDARPIGMVTLWEQEAESSLPLEPISIPDWNHDEGRTGNRYFSDPQKRPGRYYAILDGRQRSTALALAFGGLRASSGLYRNAGRYFLDVCAEDDAERVKFISEKDIAKRNIGTLKSAVSVGLFPLEVEDPDKIFEQWMSYLQHIRDPGFYENNILPSEAELDRRNKILQSAFNGIIKTKIALYVVPKSYDLAEICDIFQTLNTTGTKVSTVDLIHSNIYSDTAQDVSGPVVIRDSIDELGELDGAIGWASSRDRPELIAQFAAAIHVGLEQKAEPRAIGARKDYKIASVKSRDLLAIPALHWRMLFQNNAEFAGFLGGFQQAVAGGPFGMSQCPYPASAAIYLALRWYLHTDGKGKVHWSVSHLNELFRAFFWRNTLLTRYDQGFLTQIGTDIKEIKEYLAMSKPDENPDAWRTTTNAWLDDYFSKPVEHDLVRKIVTDGGEAGALKRASVLLLHARATFDVIDTSESIRYGSGNLQLHHIFPKDWCANNKSGTLASILDEDRAGRDWVNSAANLMPMARTSNIMWRKKSPQQVIEEQKLNYDATPELWSQYLISRKAFELLAEGTDQLPAFWELRSQLLSDEIMRRTLV